MDAAVGAAVVVDEPAQQVDEHRALFGRERGEHLFPQGSEQGVERREPDAPGQRDDVAPPSRVAMPAAPGVRATRAAPAEGRPASPLP